MAGFEKEWVIVPWAGRRRWVMGFLFRRPGFPIINGSAHSGLHLGLVHCFWTILGGILAGFIILEQILQGFHAWDPV